MTINGPDIQETSKIPVDSCVRKMHVVEIDGMSIRTVFTEEELRRGMSNLDQAPWNNSKEAVEKIRWMMDATKRSAANMFAQPTSVSKPLKKDAPYLG